MNSFSELLGQLSPDEYERGKQFEKICKWFLETDRRYSNQISNVWLWDDWPGRWGPDSGIDLIAEDREGKIWAIQAKCYDEDYSVTKTDIDKFLSESTHELIDHRILIATTDKIAKRARTVMNNQNKVISVNQILRHDLETAPLVWPSDPTMLLGGGYADPKEPRPHQEEAIRNITDNLSDRGQFISACGTGKTLTSLWVTEKLNSRLTLVLVPSLTLLSQTISDWLSNSNEQFNYLPVCSDATVKADDAAVMFTAELPYPPTTKPEEIAAFMKGHGRRVVFSTYQSSQQIQAAQEVESVPEFDLVLADEAHRCAGKVDSTFTTVLSDSAIRSKRRLFMTATPRTVSAGARRKAKEYDIEIASMDDETLFGPVLHELSFAEAIRRELLTDYRVVIIGVNNKNYSQMIDSRLIVSVEGTDIQTDARTLGKHVALAKAIRDYDLRRTITFHSRIDAANSFANMLPKVVSWMRPEERPEFEVVTDHISGEMSTGDRNRKLSRLREVEKNHSAVLTNARCLSEGIDVPSLDGISFVDPRRSQIDIIQAVGRAIRKSDDKTFGTIVIPVFLDETNDPEEALSNSEFEPVWAVLNALRSHDKSLAYELDQFRVEIGKLGSTRRLPPKVIIDFPTNISGEFADSFATRLVESTTSSWEANFGALLSYIEEFGDAVVVSTYVTDSGIRLGNWVARQRQQYKENSSLRPRLGKTYIDRLDELEEWTWFGFEQIWISKFQKLKEYYDEFGNLDVQKRYKSSDGTNLGLWVMRQRKRRDNGVLDQAYVDQIDSLPGSFPWQIDSWPDNFQEFSTIYKRHQREPTVLASEIWAEVYSDLSPALLRWYRYQLEAKRISSGQNKVPSRGVPTITPHKIKLLGELPGWEWDAPVKARTFTPWIRKFENALSEIIRLRESSDNSELWPSELTSDYKTKDGWQLGRWIFRQKQYYHRDEIAHWKIHYLKRLPQEWLLTENT